MEIIRVKDYQALSELAASIIIEAVKSKPNISLGLATGGSPVGLYANLVKDHKENKTSYKQISTYNLDEYVGLDPTHEQSYITFMKNHLFNHIDIDMNNVHLPLGNTADPIAEARRYEDLVSKVNIDIQLLGIGTNGHIGFNEPGSDFNGQTSVVNLVQDTIAANARFFAGQEDLVPTKAISMGISTILKAKKILLIASGKSKAQAVKEFIEGPVTADLPATALKNHPNVTVIIDEDAASLLED